MAVRSQAAPPTPWSKNLTEPKIHETAYVHSFSNIIGDVRIGANVLIAPGTSIRADEGTPFYIGENTNLQDGVVIHGLEQGRVIGDDQNKYSVWVGKNASITHMALIHGPAYVGDDCFIGFRSTVFNARVGNGCIVMMHALIKDVEVPAGKYVPSGSIITTQKQADRLPDVQPDDLKFARHVIGINDALRIGYHCSEDLACLTDLRDEVVDTNSFKKDHKDNLGSTTVASMKLNEEARSQIRNLLGQGYHIGTEHADERRFRVCSWSSCSPIQSKQEYEVVSALEACMTEHSGEYVRLFGIDPKVKRRVSEVIIQRPDGPVASPNGSAKKLSTNSAPSSSGGNSTSTGLSAEVVEQVRSLLAQGYKVGIEHADDRRYRTSSWKTGIPIQSNQESAVLASIEENLSEYTGEYVRLIGIDPKVKRRVLELLIQNPNGKSEVTSAPKTNGSHSHQANGNSSSTATATTSLSSDVVEQVRSLINQGYRIGVEYADERRYRTSSWKSAAAISSNNLSEVLSALQANLSEHDGEYVRLIGIDPKVKRRVAETIIQQPTAK